VIAAGRLQQGVGAGDVGFDECGRAVNGAVHVGFCRQVQDGVGPVLVKAPGHLGGIADIHLLKGVPGTARYRCQGLKVPGIGQLVQVHHMVRRMGDQMADQGGADEAGAAGNEQVQGCLVLGVGHSSALSVTKGEGFVIQS
jgi:hypothetical protein